MEQQILNTLQALNTIMSQWVTTAKAVFPRLTTTQTTVGAAGTATALPAQPLGYMNITLPDGTAVVVPYYNPS